MKRSGVEMSVNPDIILRKEDCEVSRTAEDLIAWIESVDRQFRADDRIEEELIKKFFEEIMPLGHLARHKYLGRPGLSLRPRVGYQNYDAEIIDTSSGTEHITRIEFTSGYRDEDLALRMEYLAEHGGVAFSGPVWRDGKKASGGKIHAVLDCEDAQSRFDHLVATCEERIANKLRKPYAAGTIIAIVFNDFIPEQDMPQIQLYFRDILSKQALSKFCGVYILGASGKTFWEFGETTPSASP